MVSGAITQKRPSEIPAPCDPQNCALWPTIYKQEGGNTEKATLQWVRG